MVKSYKTICDMVINASITLLTEEDEVPTEEQVAKAIKDLYEGFKTKVLAGMEIDSKEEEEGLRYILNSVTRIVSIKGPEATVIISEELKNKTSWYRREEIPADGYWSRYIQKVKAEPHLGPMTAKKLDQATDKIIKWFGNPSENSAFNRKGLAMGHVQSGKTLNMAGVIAKGMDVGYRDIIVLAGAWNSLRSQTQNRFEKDLIGYTLSDDGVTAEPVGVGLPFKWNIEKLLEGCHLLTHPNSDFTGQITQGIGAVFHNDRTSRFFIVKKNKTVLERLHKYLKQKEAFDRRSALIIDDECDHYSLNSKVRKDEATITNKLVRNLVNPQQGYKKSTYIGYSATPFANLLVSRQQNVPPAILEEIGEDLFPKDFIIPLEPPSNYVGLKQLFGDGEMNDGDETYEVYRDTESWIPRGIKKDSIINAGFFPKSLKEALDAFLLGTAGKWIRERQKKTAPFIEAAGGYEPTSMLIHATILTNLHVQIKEQVQEYVQDLRTRLRGNRDNPEQEDWARLKSRWENDFTVKTKALSRRGLGEEASEIHWREIKEYLLKLLDDQYSTPVDLSNSTNKASDDWEAYRSKARILIGGITLSRGITLEGLIVSYFLKHTKKPNTDTLTQMGRWFGYRDGYRDLCRLYTERRTIKLFEDLCFNEEDARQQLRILNDEGKTPSDVAIKLRTHPGMGITAQNRIGYHVQQVNITSNFFGRPNYVYQYSTKKEDLENNFKVFSELVTSSGQRCEKHKDFKYPEEMSGLKLRGNNIFYRGVPKEKIVKFLSEFRGASGHSSQPGHIVKSLRKTEYVTDWTVMVANLSPGPDEKTFPCDLPFALRPLTRGSRVDDMYSITREEKFSVKQISEGTGGDRVADVVYDICDSESSNTEEVSKAYARWLEYARNESGSKMIKEDGTVKFSLLNRCREKNSGLLLLYPFRAKDCDGKEFESEFPFIGVSVMLGEVPDWKSSTAEYMVNPTLDNQSIEDQEENDGDTTNE